MKQKAQIVLALDVDNFKKAAYFVNKLFPEIKIFKVGLQLFTSSGPKVIDFINRKGAGVFLDLKLFDIPNTVAQAVRMAVRLKVRMLTLHISGGSAMLEAAVDAARDEAGKLKLKRPLLIGVTVLTSQAASPATILKLTKSGLESGLDGVVCSAREAAFLKKSIHKKFYIITPGIRPNTAAKHDQKRTATVAQAVKAGSDFLVMGRPILEAEDPAGVTKRIVVETNIMR